MSLFKMEIMKIETLQIKQLDPAFPIGAPFIRKA